MKESRYYAEHPDLNQADYEYEAFVDPYAVIGLEIVQTPPSRTKAPRRYASVHISPIKTDWETAHSRATATEVRDFVSNQKKLGLKNPRFD